MLTALHLWSSLRQYSHCFPIHISPGLHLNPELSTHPVIRELDTPWMTNPREKISSVNSTQKESRFETIALLSLSRFDVCFMYSSHQRLSGTKNSTATRGSSKREPVAVIGTDYFRVDLQGLQALSKPQIHFIHLSRHIHIYSEAGADWDKISGWEISHSSRPSHTPTTNSETWTTLLAYLYDHHIKRSKSLVGAVENN